MDLSSHRVTDEKSSWVITQTTLGNFFYMQISTAIIEKNILFNTVEGMHDNVTHIMPMLTFSW